MSNLDESSILDELKKINSEIKSIKVNHEQKIKTLNDKIDLLSKNINLSSIMESKSNLKVSQVSSIIDKKSGPDFDFDAYKIEVIRNDCKKISEHIKNKKFTKWYYFIPLVGFIIYSYQLNLIYSGIDRGLLRQNYQKFYIRWILFEIIQWCVGLPFVINLEPMIAKSCFKKALAKTMVEIEMDSNEL